VASTDKDLVGRAGTSAVLLAGAVLACQPATTPQKPAPPTVRVVPRPSRQSQAPAPTVPLSSAAQKERLVFDASSGYSHIQVVDSGATRTLYFVHDGGNRVVESRYRPDAPALLDVAYTRVMFASFLLRRDQHRCLIVGLGGGSMVRFLRRFFPEGAIDAVEIDPLVVEVAARYFAVAPSEGIRIITADAHDYIARTSELYDVVYMDAFLKVSTETDSTGVPAELRTQEFLSKLKERLRPGGLVVTNIHQRLDTPRDIQTLGTGFASEYVFPVTGTGNVIVVSSLSAQRVERAELERRGRALDRRADYGFSFEAVAKMLEP
jgi:spermidine synthase